MTSEKEISVFVDESGSYDSRESSSRYYFVCMVLHDQDSDIRSKIVAFEDRLAAMGLARDRCIHAGPLVRREEEYAALRMDERRAIFFKMLSFVHQADISYRCFAVDKHYIDRSDSIHDALLRDMVKFLIARADDFSTCAKLKVYYDRGQSQVTRILKEAFALYASKVVFVSEVTPARYRLFQAADLVCTLELAARKLEDGLGLSASENAFYGGPRSFKRDILKQIRSKRIE